MDIRRLPLWEGRNATIMNNGEINAVIEDQGEVMLELSNQVRSGARVNPLAIPYFRGFGSGVDPISLFLTHLKTASRATTPIGW